MATTDRDGLPRLCALLVTLLFACALADRADDRGWRDAADDVALQAASAPARVDDQRPTIPAAATETRYVAGIGESRVRTESGPVPHGVNARATTLPPATCRLPARTRAESLPLRRFLVCGYLSAPPTAPPSSAPLT